MPSKKEKAVLKTKKRKRAEQIFAFLVVLVLVLASLNIAKAKGWLIPEQPEIAIAENVIDLSSLSLEQKIAQMIIVAGASYNKAAFKAMQVGGIHLFAMETEELFKKRINDYQEGMTIPFLVTVDLEGCQNPFANFHSAVSVSEIQTIGQAFEKGSEDGKYLQALGFNVNYAPVVDLEDQIWKCRSFPGNETEIAAKAEAYILGLQSEQIIATAKHYPGKTLVVKDPHKYLVTASIDNRDLYPYNYLSEKGDIKAIMITHIIASGDVNSQGNPSVASDNVIQDLKKRFNGLIITDEINMLGLKNFYPSLDAMYIAVFKAGNDLILNFHDDPTEIYRMINVIHKAVIEGMIPEEQINHSVKKILMAKGFNVYSR